MARNQTFHAIILKNRDYEDRRIITLLTEEEGLLEAILYGGSKSKLRGLASPFHSGTAWIYRDPVRNSDKLSDFDVSASRPSIRENLVKMWSAALWAEFCMKTHAQGESFEKTTRFLDAALNALDVGSEIDAQYLSIIYLWQCISALGLEPSLEHCAQCGRVFMTGEAIRLDLQEGGFLCGDCVHEYAQNYAHDSSAQQNDFEGTYRQRQRNQARSASPGTRSYLKAIRTKTLHEALRIKLDAACLIEAKAIIFALADKAAEEPLKTLLMGTGIIS